MEKTKAELYLEKLEKWRKEKQAAKQKEKQHVIKSSFPKSAEVKPLARVVKPALKDGAKVPARCSTQGATSQVKPSRPLVAKTTSKHEGFGASGVRQKLDKNGILLDSQKSKAETTLSSKKVSVKSKVKTITEFNTPKVETAKPVLSKSEKKRHSEEKREILRKLEKWRLEKGRIKSEKKKPVTASHMLSGKKEMPGKFIKSRLFDYQNKQKENKNVNVLANKTAEKSSKPQFKRRHSEFPRLDAAQRSKGGILKRKSCTGSFDLEIVEGVSQTKRRRLSYTKPETTVARIEEPCIEPVPCDKPISEVPLAVVTPGVHTRNVRFTTPPGQGTLELKKTLRKTPKTPATRQTELNDWLKAKGRTPSKFRHLMCFHADQSNEKKDDPHTKNSLSVEDLAKQMDVLEQERLEAKNQQKMSSLLDECMILFEAGCPAESILPWLDDIYKQIPCARTSARYYTCKASVIKSSLDLDAVLEVFEQATINDAKPKEEIAKSLTDTLKFVTEEKVRQARRKCRTPRQSEVQETNVFESSTVVYTVSNITPFSERKRSTSRRDLTPSKCQRVTPVRRSTRRSLQNLPESLKDKNPSYRTLEEVQGKEDVFFQSNLALEALLHAVEEVE